MCLKYQIASEKRWTYTLNTVQVFKKKDDIMNFAN